MRSKSEPLRVVTQHIQHLQVALGESLRPYHSNNAHELQHKHLLDMLNSQGTSTITTTSHTSQQNGLAERRFLTIFNAVRATLAHGKIDK